MKESKTYLPKPITYKEFEELSDHNERGWWACEDCKTVVEVEDSYCSTTSAITGPTIKDNKCIKCGSYNWKTNCYGHSIMTNLRFKEK
jgi:hypothetical protein